MINPSTGEYENVVRAVVSLYKKGEPVVVFATDGTYLHGRETLEAFAASGQTQTAYSIDGIDREKWEATDCPELCEAARQVFYLNHPQSMHMKLSRFIELMESLGMQDPNPRKDLN